LVIFRLRSFRVDTILVISTLGVSFLKPGIRGRPMAKRIVDVLVPVALDQARA
jgi:hypothetical protein